jgi:pSer/pThr/pTyr-binding forkhead associated (FHA) protein
MSGPIVLALRLLMALSLYAFLGWALYTLWLSLQQEAEKITSRRAPEISLTVPDGNGAHVVRHFIQSEITLGRDPICDVAILDETASARHARVSYHHGQWWVEDLGSTNGTRLNQLPVSFPTVLTSGDEIRCGNVPLVVNMTADVYITPTQRLTEG